MPSDAMRVWREASDAYFGETGDMRPGDPQAAAAVIERAITEAVEQERARIVAWLRIQQHGRTSDNYPSYYARRIEDGEWK